MGDAAPASMRRVRPWIAALLTLLGWGLGFYYARRTKTALWLSLASVAAGILAGAVLVFGIGTHASWLPARPMPFPLSELIRLGIATPFAVWAWIATAKHPLVAKAGAARLWGYFGIWLLPIFLSATLAMPIRWTLVQPFRMPSGSMEPTIHRGEYFIASKWAYGYSRYSFAPLDGLLPKGRWLARTPERGDIVVFRPVGETRDFVKRIVGMPGDRVQMIDGVLHINGRRVERESIGALNVGEPDAAAVPGFVETLPNGVRYITLDRYPDWELDNTRVFAVPAGHYFMLGDDRDFSLDSRTTLVAYVPFDNLIGRVEPSTTIITFPAPGD